MLLLFVSVAGGGEISPGRLAAWPDVEQQHTRPEIQAVLCWSVAAIQYEFRNVKIQLKSMQFINQPHQW